MSKLENPHQAIHTIIRSPFNKILPTCVFYEESLDLVFGAYENDLIMIFEGKTGEKKATLRGHHSKVTSMVVAMKKDSGLLLISASEDLKKKGDTAPLLWDVKVEGKGPKRSVDGRLIKKLTSHTLGVSCLESQVVYLGGSVKKELNVVISASFDGTINVFTFEEGKEGECVLHFSNLKGSNDGISSIALDQEKDSLDDLLVCASYNGSVTIYNLTQMITTPHRAFGREKTGVECVKFDGERMLVYTGETSGCVCIWDVNDKNSCTAKVLPKEHDGLVTRLAQTEFKIATGGQDGKILVFDKVEGTIIADMDQKHTACVSRLDFIESHLLVSASEDGSVKMHILQ